MGNLMTTGEKPSPQTTAQPEGADAVPTSAHRLRRSSPARGDLGYATEVSMKKLSLSNVLVFLAAVLLCPSGASAQNENDGQLRSAVRSTERANEQQPNVPAEARQAEDTVERAVRRFRLGVSGGVALDPELIDFGAHAAFGPLFNPNVEFRPGIEFGLGEVTTLFGINLDVLYTLPGATRQTRWMPYVGGGPNFALSHRGFESDTDDNGNRFDFSDTDFDGGFNFIAGARSQRGLFFEMKATAWGVSNVRLLAGFNF
jgi:hypothetical protein